MSVTNRLYLNYGSLVIQSIHPWALGISTDVSLNGPAGPVGTAEAPPGTGCPQALLSGTEECLCSGNIEGLLQNTGPGHTLASREVPSGVLCVCLCKRLCRPLTKVPRFPRCDSGLNRTSDPCQECPPVGTRFLSSPRIGKRTATVLVGLFSLQSASWNKAVKADCSPEVITCVGAEQRPKTEKDCGWSQSWSTKVQDDLSSTGTGLGRAGQGYRPRHMHGPSRRQQPQKGLGWGDACAGAWKLGAGREPGHPAAQTAGDRTCRRPVAGSAD